MTRQKKKTEMPAGNDQQVAVAPVSVTETDSLKAKETTLTVPPGHVMIVALNTDGTEKEGSEFFYPEKSYKRFYGDETKYAVKKKVQ